MLKISDIREVSIQKMMIYKNLSDIIWEWRRFLHLNAKSHILNIEKQICISAANQQSHHLIDEVWTFQQRWSNIGTWTGADANQPTKLIFSWNYSLLYKKFSSDSTLRIGPSRPRTMHTRRQNNGRVTSLALPLNADTSVAFYIWYWIETAKVCA